MPQTVKVAGAIGIIGEDGTVGIIRDQSLPFMFEVMDTATGLPIKQFLLPINPTTCRKVNTTRSTVTQTAGGAFEDNKGNALPQIMLQGTFGFLGTLKGGPGTSLEPMPMDGWGHTMILEATFLDFYDRFGTYNAWGDAVKNPVDPKHLPELRFYNYTDLDYYVVKIDRFELNRSTQRRFLYQYDIQMTALRRVKEPSISEEDMSALLDDVQPPPSLSMWQQALELYTSVSLAMAEVINEVNQMEQEIATVASSVAGFINGTTDLVMCQIGLLQSINKSVDSIMAKVGDLEELPHEFIDALRNVKRTNMNLQMRPDIFSQTEETANVEDTSAAISTQEIITVDIPQTSAAQEMGLVGMANPETTLFDPSLVTVQEVAASITDITRNDTIETIARQTLGDATAWKRIAMLNDLEYPFIVQDLKDALSSVIAYGTLGADIEAGDTSLLLAGITPQEGYVLLIDDGTTTEVVTIEDIADTEVNLSAPISSSYPAASKVTMHERRLSVLLPGDQLQIPGDAATGAAISATSDDFYATIYGTDELLLDDGTQQGSSTGDIETVSGIANLQQALQHRVRTLRGELASLGHPRYGSYLPKLIGQVNTPVWYHRAVLEAEITMLEDPRVRAVEQVKLISDGTALYLEADIYPINKTAATSIRLLVS